MARDSHPLLILLALVAACTRVLSEDNITSPLKIPQGSLTGRIRTTMAGTHFLSFQGIPYAKPPVGELRYKAPLPPEPWSGVLAAHAEGNICPQELPFDAPKAEAMRLLNKPKAAAYAAKLMSQRSEDCLVLNVYTPMARKPLPVLVWIHGGAFQAGDSTEVLYGPDYFMDKGLVLVTLNYRLNSFGFLSTNTADAPGNAGLKDQVQALRWVRDNIEHFAGDPRQVTIYGESAGGAAVHLHVLSPMSKGLFRAAIAASSMAPTSYVITTDPMRHAKKLAMKLGASQETIEDPAMLVHFMRNQNMDDIIDNSPHWPVDDESPTAMSCMSFTPVVEPVGSSQDVFLDKNPNDILRSGAYTKVPLMAGTVNKEGSLWFFKRDVDAYLPKMDADYTTLLPDNLYDKLDPKTREEVALKVKKFYFGDDHINRDTLENVVNAIGDGMIAHGVSVATHWHSKQATPEAPFFVYELSRDSEGIGFSLLIGAARLNGSGHFDDLAYVFRHAVLNDLATSNPHYMKGKAQLTELISNFVKTLDPVPKKSDVIQTDWPTSTYPAEKYLDIGDEQLLVKQGRQKERMNFWDEICREHFGDPIYNYDTK